MQIAAPQADVYDSNTRISYLPRQSQNLDFFLSILIEFKIGFCKQAFSQESAISCALLEK